MRSERHVKILLAVVTGVVLISSIVHADDYPPGIPIHSLDFGLQTMSFDYQEPTIDVGISGLMYGLSGNYTYRYKKLMVDADMELSLGTLEYDGWISDGTTRSPVKDDSRDYLVGFRGLIGYVYPLNNKSVITIFTGLGCRYWNNDVEGPGSYEREIGYLYAPFGVKMDFVLSDNWQWGASIEYDFFLRGQVISHLSDVNPGYNDPENDQDTASGYGTRFSLRFSRKLARKHTLTIEPFIRYWDIDKSDTSIITFYGSPIGMGLEPENETMTYGLRFSFNFQLN
jgi:hypothetical protein